MSECRGKCQFKIRCLEENRKEMTKKTNRTHWISGTSVPLKERSAQQAEDSREDSRGRTGGWERGQREGVMERVGIGAEAFLPGKGAISRLQEVRTCFSPSAPAALKIDPGGT